MFIDGEFVDGVGVAEVTNPATEKVIAAVATASVADVERAIAAARRSFDAGVWSGRTADYRAEVLRRMLDYLAQRRDLLLSMIVQEAGCPVGSPVIGAQLDSPLQLTREHVDIFLKLPEEEDGGLPTAARIGPMGGVVQSLRRYAPVGVVTAISAYNFPLFLNLWKVIPALITGNSVILRPSPLTPLTALVLADAARAAGLPAGVFNVVVETALDGALMLTTDPRVDMVTFTGSSSIGEKVMAQAAPTMKRLQLELGGKSAAIYLPDSIDRAIYAANGVCLAHAGQGCVLGTRVMVPKEDKARVLAGMRDALAGVVIGDPANPATQMGPVISAAQRARCEAYVGLALEAGAELVVGGRRPSHLPGGYFFEPTVLDVPDNANPAARDEIFGPVVSVIGYDSIDHAVAMANDTEFGLSGYVNGRNVAEAVAIARRIRSGTVNVNTGAMSAYVSSGGWRRSGLGRERGPEGLRVYQNLQVINFSN
jgi:aldehyde dehydrogenase (NAD+)